jgi:hypothetical protein
MYFANSSTIPSFVALLFIVSVGPLMQEFIFAEIHLYIVCWITLCLLPSKADSKLIINFIIVRTEISAWYVINIFLVFLLAASAYSLKYYYLGYYPNYWYIEPVLMGIWSSICYLILFGLVIMFTEEKRIHPAKRQFYLERERLKVEDEEILHDLEIQ